jgi:hypothetical protein
MVAVARRNTLVEIPAIHLVLYVSIAWRSVLRYSAGLRNSRRVMTVPSAVLLTSH